jgi:hypothetical protein
MNLTRQPPRRPSNLSVAGIVGAARMTDKARAHDDETLGDYVYGGDSGLDRRILDFIGVSAEEFVEAATENSDETQWVLDKFGKTQAEIDAFNETELSALPATDAYRQRLKDRIAKYAPGRTDIKTIIQSIELDDWGNFWQVDLTQRPPRSAHCRDVAGCFGVARMADKARGERTGKIGEYVYGEASGQDRVILGFLGISAADFQEAAVNNPNNLELAEWVLEQTDKTPDEIATFTHEMSRRGPTDEQSRAYFENRIQQVDPSRTDIKTWADLQDLDDQLSYGIIDLARRAPRSPYEVVGGYVHLGRTIDKARAHNSNSLGEYWYGEDSGMDKFLLDFLDLPAQEFVEAVKTLPTDEDVVNWLKTRCPKTDAEIAEQNESHRALGSQVERQNAFIRGIVQRLDPSRTDIQTFFDLMVLADEKEFERP